MADYYQVKNQNIFTPPANISLGNTSNQYNNVYVQNNLVVGNVTVTSSTIIAPRVTTITYPGNDTAADPAGGQTITLTGSGFVVSASILINSIAVSVVSVVSSTVITFTSPANSSGSYVIYVVNPDGSTAIAVPGIQYSGIPTWTTAAGTLGNLYETASFTQTVVATGDAPITYSVASGTLPPGATFNGNGTITGTSQLTASPTTYTFTVSATDAEQQDTNRSFSLTINTDVVTWTTPAANSTTTLGQNVASTTTLLATSAAGKAITYTANALPTGLSISGATVTGTPTVAGNTSSLFTATAATTGRTTTATINWTITVSGDTYFPYTTLLLSGGTSTSTFIADASTNNFALAIAGDTKPNNFNPYTPGYYSNYFDGTGDYLTVPYSSVFDYGTGDFTIEAWIYLTITPYQGDAIFCSLTTGGSAFQFYSSTQLALGNTGIAWRAISNSTSFPICTWHHVAVSRASGTAYFWLNGVNIGTVAETNAFNAASSAIAIGKSDSGIFTGYISNLRVLKGTALYTTTFTPSTTPLTAIANTSLLTCQSNRFIDNSTNAFVVTKYGDTTVSPATPFVPNTQYATYGSTYFDGTGDYLVTPSSSAFNFGTGDFQIEAWVYLFNVTDRRFIYGTGGTGQQNQFWIETDRKVGYYDGTADRYSTGTIQLNSWNQVALARSGSTCTFYVNGVASGTFTSSASLGATSQAYIGRRSDALYEVAGYISDLRILKGVTSAPSGNPTSPLSAITGTSLLTCQTNQPANNSVFLDNSTNAFAVTRVGNTTQGTFSPYGANWSNYFDGTGDYLSIANNVVFDYGTGDCTFEVWVYIQSYAQYQFIVYSQVVGTTSGNGYQFYVTNSGYLAMESQVAGVDQAITATNNAISLNTWTHVAFTRASGTNRLFVNGNLCTTTGTLSQAISTGGNAVYLGAYLYSTTTYYFNGYISNVRLVKGTAVYTSAFTPSTTPLTAIANTSLLTCQSNRIVDNSANAFTITKTGDVSVQRFSPFSPTAAYSTSTIGGSGYLSGASSTWLAVPINATFAFGTNNYTYEAWVYPTAFPNAYNTIFCNFRDDEGSKGWSLLITSTGLIHVNNQGTYNNSTNALSLNTWTHIAVCRVGNTVTRYINGVADPTTLTVTASITNVAAQGPTIGGSPEYSTTREWTGYISNARVISGTALYTSNFTPSTTPFTAVSGTSLLLNYTNAGVYDSTMINDLETVGDAKILSTQTPYAGSYYSNYFNGSSNFTSSTSQIVPTGSFTVECWVYVTSTANQAFVAQGTSANAARFSIAIDGGLWWTQIGNASINTGTPIINTWNYLAVTFNGSTLTLYVNGASIGTVATSTSAQNTTLTIGTLGSSWAAGYFVTGYISNVRVSSVVRTIITPTAPYTSDASTRLLTCQSNRFLDNSANAFALTITGTPSVQSFNPFQRNSATTMSFDGTGDYLSIPSSVNFTLGTGDFTIEMWVYPVSIPTDTPLIDGRDGTGTAVKPCLFIQQSSNNFIYYVNGGIRIQGGTPSLNAWQHVALVRNSGSTKVYINGTQAGSTYTDTNNYLTCGYRIAAFNDGSTSYCLNGYINDFRLTKGVARYTTTFTPPTSAFLTT